MRSATPFLRAAPAAVIVLLLPACAAPEPAPEVLSASRAGGLYLDAVCPVNAAWDRADAELDRLRIAAARGEPGAADAARFADAMRAVARASERAAARLAPEDRAWPEHAADEIAAVRETLRADAEQAAEVAGLPAPEAVSRPWEGGDAAGAAAAEARDALGLPADGEAACGQWAEREASDG